MTSASGVSTTLAAHAAHVAVALVPAGLMVTALVVETHRERKAARLAAQPVPPPTIASRAPGVAALCLVGAGVVHASVIRSHLRESLLFGVFFIVLAALQGIWALLLLRKPSDPVLAMTIVANLAVVLLWAASRTVGLPLGPSAGTPESVGPLDVLATAYELGAVAAALVGVRAAHRTRSRLLAVRLGAVHLGGLVAVGLTVVAAGALGHA